MDSDFSHKTNDEKAVTVARRISDRFPPGSLSSDDLSALCDFLSTYAKLDYATTMSIVNRLEYGGSAFDTLRLAYSLIHHDPRMMMYTGGRAETAHAKVILVTADRVDTANPRICLKLLLVSSSQAGTLIDTDIGLRDAVKLQKKIYSGRSRALSGRSMLEFVGCQVTAKLKGRVVILIDADKAEKKYNKDLCSARAKADSDCTKSKSCVLCRERRTTCRLAVRN